MMSALHPISPTSASTWGNLAREGYFWRPVLRPRPQRAPKRHPRVEPRIHPKRRRRIPRHGASHVLDARVGTCSACPKPATVHRRVRREIWDRAGRGYWGFRQVPRSTYEQYAADDYAGGFIRFENGAGLQVESFWASHQPNELQNSNSLATKAGAQFRPLKIYKTQDGVPHDHRRRYPACNPGMGIALRATLSTASSTAKTCEAPPAPRISSAANDGKPCSKVAKQDGKIRIGLIHGDPHDRLTHHRRTKKTPTLSAMTTALLQAAVDYIAALGGGHG